MLKPREVGELVWCHTARARPRLPTPHWPLNAYHGPHHGPHQKFLSEYSRHPFLSARNDLAVYLNSPSAININVIFLPFLQHFTNQREEFEGTRESILVWLTEMDLQLTNVEHFSESDADDKMRQLNVRPAPLAPLKRMQLCRGELAKHKFHLIP